MVCDEAEAPTGTRGPGLLGISGCSARPSRRRPIPSPPAPGSQRCLSVGRVRSSGAAHRGADPHRSQRNQPRPVPHAERPRHRPQPDPTPSHRLQKPGQLESPNGRLPPSWRRSPDRTAKGTPAGDRWPSLTALLSARDQPRNLTHVAAILRCVQPTKRSSTRPWMGATANRYGGLQRASHFHKPAERSMVPPPSCPKCRRAASETSPGRVMT